MLSNYSRSNNTKAKTNLCLWVLVPPVPPPTHHPSEKPILKACALNNRRSTWSWSWQNAMFATEPPTEYTAVRVGFVWQCTLFEIEQLVYSIFREGWEWGCGRTLELRKHFLLAIGWNSDGGVLGVTKNGMHVWLCCMHTTWSVRLHRHQLDSIYRTNQHQHNRHVTIWHDKAICFIYIVQYCARN